MSLCTIDYVKSKIYTGSLSDLSIQYLINSTRQDVLDLCGVSDDSNVNIALAVKYSVIAAVLMYLKTTDELAASVETPGSKYQHTTDKDIDFWQAKADKITQPYEKAKLEMLFSYSSPSCHIGFDSCSWGR